MLNDVTVWVSPVVVHLTSKDMPSDAPKVRSVLLGEVGVAGHEIIDIGHFEGGMVVLRLPRSNEEKRVVIHEHVTAIAAKKCAEGSLLVQSDLIGGEESEPFLVPGF